VIPLDRLGDGVVEAGPLLVLPAGRCVVVVKGDAGPGRELLDCFHEIELLGLPDKGDDIAPGATAEAVVQALVGVDGK
jgi:hypothetical protein